MELISILAEIGFLFAKRVVFRNSNVKVKSMAIHGKNLQFN
jgi:hypothetical protein